MMAEAGRFIYRGGGRDDIPDEVTHVTTNKSVTVIPLQLFYEHPNIVLLVCHKNVKWIGMKAFYKCPRLKLVLMRGVDFVADRAFCQCESLSYINLPSAKIVQASAFYECEAIKTVTFGKDLESVGEWAFFNCHSLKLITIPLKNDLFPSDHTFQGCQNLIRIDLVEGEVLNDTVAALFLDEWREDMRTVIDSINHDLPNAPAGDIVGNGVGEKTIVVRRWISSVLSKIIRYKAQHRGLFNAYAAEPSLIHPELPDEIVRNNVLPFLELPSHTFDGEDNTVVIDPDLADLELPRE